MLHVGPKDTNLLHEEPKDRYRIKDEVIDAIWKHFEADDGETRKTNNEFKERLKRGINVSKDDIKRFLSKWRE